DNHPATLRQHVANFLIRHCQMPTGKKIFNILMRQLANEINDSRLDVSKTLNEMEEEGLLILSRGKITVPAIERIIE
ncbi:helix-turn-helix domain-containing protein, partial [Acinetobacter baumannii]